MGSMLGNWPSYDPHNFSQLRPSNPAQPSKLTAVTYHPTHNRTLPPANQGLTLLFEKHCMPDRGPRFKCDLPFPRGSSRVQRFYQHAPIKTSRPTKMHTTPIIRKQVVWDARHGVFPGHRRKKKVISTEETNILLRQFYQRAEEKLRTKRSAPDNLTPDHGCKQPRGSFEGGPN